MHQVQLSDQVYEQARRHASKAGFKSVDEFLENIVLEREAEETGNYDHRFTPKVMAHLDQIRAEVRAGAKTYTEEEVENRFLQKSEAWRDSQAS